MGIPRCDHDRLISPLLQHIHLFSGQRIARLIVDRRESLVVDGSALEQARPEVSVIDGQLISGWRIHLLLERGQIAQLGPAGEVVARYVAQSDGSAAPADFRPGSRSGTGWARVVGMRMLDEYGRAVGAVPCDADLRFEVDLALRDAVSSGASLRGLVLELGICSALGQPILSLMNVDDSGVDLPAASSCRVQVRLPGPTFVPGRYCVNVFLGLPYLQHVDEVLDAVRFDILPPRKPWRPYELYESRGLVCRRAEWQHVEPTALATVVRDS